MSDLANDEIEFMQAVWFSERLPSATREQDALRRRLKRKGLVEFDKGWGWCLTERGMAEIGVFNQK